MLPVTTFTLQSICRQKQCTRSEGQTNPPPTPTERQRGWRDERRCLEASLLIKRTEGSEGETAHRQTLQSLIISCSTRTGTASHFHPHNRTEGTPVCLSSSSSSCLFHSRPLSDSPPFLSVTRRLESALALHSIVRPLDSRFAPPFMHPSYCLHA